ncbi:hypothetical protein [Acinetobacter terrestris]|uniref:hypothetical protein n=1 Tax=Acinetobacter terrestris TaxID=2529843 RepID=UPI001BC870D1|nr:hypothetical protein [Acinetobacter terrestris]
MATLLQVLEHGSRGKSQETMQDRLIPMPAFTKSHYKHQCKKTLGVLAYQFDTIKKDQENLDGHEIDAFAVWSPNKNINVIPLVGLYKPKKDINHLGSQVSDNKTNSYAQLILQYVY